MDLLLIEAKKGADLSDLDIRYEVDTFMFEVINLFYFTSSSLRLRGSR